MHSNIRFGLSKDKLTKLLGRTLYKRSEQYLKNSIIKESKQDYGASSFFITGPQGTHNVAIAPNIDKPKYTAKTTAILIRAAFKPRRSFM